MAASRVLKIDRSDDASSFVLLQIKSKGSKPLDLRLVATEGEEPYAATLKHDRVASLRVSSCPASVEEWQAILQSIFTQEPQPEIQINATVQSESSVSITIRKQIQGITQRLGSITLNHDSNQEIQLFEWCAAAAEASSRHKEAYVTSESRIRDLDATVTELNARLEELIEAKQQDEVVMLRGVRDLVNEKKVKIREYLQVIEASHLPEDDAVTSEQSPKKATAQSKRRPNKSRPAKRKAHSTTITDEPEDEEEVEKMEVDSIKSEPDQTDSGRVSEATASIAGDSDEEDVEIPDAPSASKALPDRSSNSSNDPTPSSKAQKKPAQQPPPRRDLPFTNRKTTKAPVAAASKDSETESDDEL